jgi:DNA modification methylase
MRRLLIWVYSGGIALNNNYSKQSEFLFYNVIDKKDFIFNADQIRIESARMKQGDKRAGTDGKVPPNWFQESRLFGTFNERVGHPTQKPMTVVEPFVLAHSNNSVLDLFGGSGSTLMACEKTKRNCFMMELDPIYCGLILDRWELMTGKTACRDDGESWQSIKNVRNG